MSHEEVAKELGISVSKVSAIERGAMKKIRASAEARRIFESFQSLAHDRARQRSSTTLNSRFAKSKRSNTK